jgi:hypothetical protein
LNRISALTNEGKHVSQKAYTKGQTLSTPLAHIQPSREDLTGLTVRTEPNKRDKDCEESQNMKDQDQAFEFREKRTDDSIDQDCEEYDTPAEECSMPIFHLVLRTRQEEDTLDESSGQVGA